MIFSISFRINKRLFFFACQQIYECLWSEVTSNIDLRYWRHIIFYQHALLSPASQNRKLWKLLFSRPNETVIYD